MRCPNCSATEDKVIETRISKEGDTIRRRRQCAVCGQRYTTYETIIPAELYVIKKNGTKVDFKPEKILFGIRQACWKRNVSEEQIDRMVASVTTRISMEMNQNYEITSQQIGEFVMDELKKVDEVAYIRFASVYRHFKDAEAFVNEVQNLPSQNGDTPLDTSKA